jgi:hypothetical protein
MFLWLCRQQPCTVVVLNHSNERTHTHTHTHTLTHTHMHARALALNGILTHSPSFRISEDSACLRPLGYCDQPHTYYSYSFDEHMLVSALSYIYIYVYNLSARNSDLHQYVAVECRKVSHFLRIWLLTVYLKGTIISTKGLKGLRVIIVCESHSTLDILEISLFPLWGTLVVRTL